MEVAAGFTSTPTLDRVHANRQGIVVVYGDALLWVSETALGFGSLAGTADEFATHLRAHIWSDSGLCSFSFLGMFVVVVYWSGFQIQFGYGK